MPMWSDVPRLVEQPAEDRLLLRAEALDEAGEYGRPVAALRQEVRHRACGVVVEPFDRAVRVGATGAMAFHLTLAVQAGPGGHDRRVGEVGIQGLLDVTGRLRRIGGPEHT